MVIVHHPALQEEPRNQQPAIIPPRQDSSHNKRVIRVDKSYSSTAKVVYSSV